jgi:hypothetical protein
MALEVKLSLAAAIGGGTKWLVFVTMFAIQEASRLAVPFSLYWANNFQKGNSRFLRY